MKAYQVYYKINPTFREDKELIIARVVARALKSRQFMPVRVLVAEGLDDVYSKMQGERWSPQGEARPLIEALGLTHTSMSAGDVILDLEENKFYEVAWSGFNEVPLMTEEHIKEIAGEPEDDGKEDPPSYCDTREEYHGLK